MPDIIYVYKCPEERKDFLKRFPGKAPPKRIGGKIMYEKWPRSNQKKLRVLRDYPHLPDQIGTNEYWWAYEAWKRLDPRISWGDIHMRQYGPSRKPSSQSNSRFVSRNRRDAFMISWEPQAPGLTVSNENRRVHDYEKAGTTTVVTKKTIQSSDKVTFRMTDEQKAANTTRGITPGLIRKEMPDTPENRIPWPEQSIRAGRRKAKKIRRRQGSQDVETSSSSGSSRRNSMGYDGSDDQVIYEEEIEHEETNDEDEYGDEQDQPFGHWENYADPQEEGSGQSPTVMTVDAGALPRHTIGGPSFRGLQTGLQSPPTGTVHVGDQTVPLPALHRTTPLGATASGKRPYGSDPSSRHSGTQIDPDDTMDAPPAQDSHLDLSTHPRFAPPLQNEHSWIQYPPPQDMPAAPNDPSHPFHIPERAPRTPSFVPTQGIPAPLNPRASSFVPSQTQPSGYCALPMPPAVARQQSATSGYLGGRNSTQYTASSPAVDQPFRRQDHISAFVRQTCPDNMTPARWKEFLDFCVTHGIPEQ
ncbi:MAG: hypothetical protein Q9169_006651 [Polycauliona sp. 2 TL-2023]